MISSSPAGSFLVAAQFLCAGGANVACGICNFDACYNVARMLAIALVAKSVSDAVGAVGVQNSLMVAGGVPGGFFPQHGCTEAAGTVLSGPCALSTNSAAAGAEFRVEFTIAAAISSQYSK